MIPDSTNNHCPYCGGHRVVVVAHDDNLSACQDCGRAWLTACPTCGSDDIHAHSVVEYWPTGLPRTQATTWHCAECGEDWTDDDEENPAPLVYVTIVGLYRDLAKMSGDFLEETFCALGSGPDTKAAIRDALQRELRGGDFYIADLDILAVFGGWRERLNPSSASAILLELEEAEEEEREEEEEEG